MNRMAVAVGCAAVAAVAFAIGRATAPTVAPTIVKRGGIVRASLDRSPPPPDAALAECETKLALARGMLEAKERAEIGEPVPFPPDLPTQFGPDGFEEAVRDAMRACPNTGLDLSRVDCSEFPCMAFFTEARNAPEGATGYLPGCDRWVETFGKWGGYASDRFATDEGLVQFSMSSVAPVDADMDENRQLRWRKRLEDGKAQLMADLGGRDLTPLELLDEQIEVFRAHGDDELPALEAKRERVAAEQGEER